MIIGNKVRLRSKVLSDARDDYNWHTDPELARLDATSLLTVSLSQYRAEYAFELCNRSSNRREFSVETRDGNHIGNCVYYGIDGDKGETQLGVMIGNRDYWDKGYGADTVTTLVNHIFSQTDLNRIHLKTLDWNTRAQKCFRKCGFTLCGHLVKDGFNFQLMDIHRKQWQEQQAVEET